MKKELFKELAIKATSIVMSANSTSGELGFNTAYAQEQWRYEFAKLVEQATLERVIVNFESSGKFADAAFIRALKDSND